MPTERPIVPQRFVDANGIGGSRWESTYPP